MRLAVIGSRTFNNYEHLKDSIKELCLNISEIVSGGAKGADTLAERYAEEFGVPIQVYKADWEGYGKVAGFKRNIEIVKNSDVVIAFWDGISKGTQHTINQAIKENKKVYIRGLS